MSFLDNVKKTAANNVNPAKPQMPGAKPPIPGKPGMPGKPPIPGKPPMPGKPVLPKAPQQQKVVAPVPEETTAAPLKKDNPFIKKPAAQAPETATAPKIGPTEEIKVDENPHALAQNSVNKVEAESKAEPEIAAVEETKEVVKEETKTSKKTSRKKTTKTSTTENADTDNMLLEDIVIPRTEISFEDAINSIKSGFVDPNWEQFREENIKKLNDIVISNDMTTSMIKSTLSELSLMKDSIWSIHNDNKTLYENITGKEPEGWIERIKKVASKGSNTEERKLNGILAVMNHKNEDGNVVNLYEVLDEMRERYNFTKSLMDGIVYKNSVLITMLGSLKLEK